MADKKKRPGRKPKNDPDDVLAIQEKIDEYFDGLPVVDKETGVQEPPTYCGLAYALGYCSLQALRDNSKGEKAIALPIKRAMLRVDISYEKGLRGQAPTGCIFALKNRGWTDKAPEDDGENKTIKIIVSGNGHLAGD